MNNIITIPKTPQEPSEINATEYLISNNSFFPDISLNEVRYAMRADGTITETRLKNAVMEAMATVNQELAPLRQQAKVPSLESLKADEIDGEHLYVWRYKRAVFCLAMANLYERYRSFDSTKDGVEKAEQYENSVDDLRRDARFAIRDLLNINRWTAELI